jgi:glycosyltransferase involved in cell wall biosynthesis
MKIAIFSINPIFPDVVTGGASKHLFQIARRLGERGHAVEVFCAQAERSWEPFTWTENVLVSPVLPFKLPFPQPYAVSGPDLALITARLRTGVVNADRFYIHDGEWLVPDVYHNIPTISSFRDNIYPESVLGTFITKADEIICVSPFSASVIEHTAGRFFPDLKKRMHQVNNGIDFHQFAPADSSPLANELGLDLDDDVILLHPHRPEPGKGLSETVRVVGRLVHQEGLKSLKVLIPEWIGEMVSDAEKDYQQKMLQLMRELGVRAHFQFIPWLPNERMPELYSLGSVTLCLGNIVEAFGNVAYESMACGTPSVIARVGVHRTLVPDELIHKVHFGDTETAAAQIVEIVNKNQTVKPETLDFMHDQMDFDRQVTAYAEIIEGCPKRGLLKINYVQPEKDTAYEIAPWCYLNGDHIYHDFKGRFEPAPILAQLFRQQAVITQVEAIKSGVPEQQWLAWVDRTWIVPKSQYK